MTGARILMAGFLTALLAASAACAAEPLQGRWLLVDQEIGGRKMPVDELTLRITPSGQTLEFAWSTPVHDIQFVSLRYLVKPDGAEGDVTNANGQKIGSVKVTRAGPLQYKVVLKGQNKPTASGTMTVSADSKTLTSESESQQPGQTAPTRMVQVFSRQ